MKNKDQIESVIPGSTVKWTATALKPAFDEAPLPAGEKERLAALDSLVQRWRPCGGSPPARELAGLGFHDAAIAEVRVIDMDLRSGRQGLRGRSRGQTSWTIGPISVLAVEHELVMEAGGID